MVQNKVAYASHEVEPGVKASLRILHAKQPQLHCCALDLGSYKKLQRCLMCAENANFQANMLSSLSVIRATCCLPTVRHGPLDVPSSCRAHSQNCWCLLHDDHCNGAHTAVQLVSAGRFVSDRFTSPVIRFSS